MFAIIESGGRQQRVEPGAVVVIDHRPGSQAGDAVTFDRILLVGRDDGEVFAGAPYVANAQVTGVVDGEARGPKIRVFKKKRRKGMRRTRGHRSVLTRVRVTEIVA